MHTITLDSVDITSQCGTSITISRSERIAGTAKFTHTPSGTPLFPADLIRQPVVISEEGEPIFTGNVNTATWDIKTRSYSIECSDLLQEQFEGESDATILALIPGSLYSTALFGEREDGWQFAEDCMSTVQRDVFLDRSGVLQTAAWAAKVTPDISLTGAHILYDGAYSLVLAKARDVITQYNLSYQYRVSRWKRRNHSFTWSFAANPEVNDWCDWAQNHGFDMPTREVVQSAAEGTSWPIDGPILFTAHPDTGSYCGGIINWGITDEAQEAVAIAASWNSIRTWAQTITETYEITLSVTAAQAIYGVAVHEQSASWEVEADDASFEDRESAYGSTWPQDAIGDRFEDQVDETIRANDLDAFLAMGATELHSQLRKNTVTVATAIMPTVELSLTANINTVDIEAQGKVSKIEHVIDETRAITRITISVSRGGAGAGDTLSVPARPDTSPGYAPPSGSTLLPTRIGGCGDVPDYDPTWDGWTTNMTPTVCHGGAPTEEQTYPLKMRIIGPDIEDEARDEIEADQPVSYTVSVPQDTLILK